MKATLLALQISLAFVAVTGVARGAPADEPWLQPKPEALQHWRDLRFGMFIHWGPVSLTGHEIGWSRGAQTPIEKYDNLYKEFNPTRFSADEWVRTAKAAGMKYVVLTTKHHDGFCLWDTKLTDYNIMNSPFHRDVVKELAAACRKQGLAFGAYYSVCDWHHPDFPLTSPGGNTHRAKADLDAYNRYLLGQIKELLTQYGPLLTIWNDVPQLFGGRGKNTIKMVRELQPDILINDRTGDGGDYSTPEQHIGGFNMQRPWETCMTICQQWAWKPNDHMKSLEECVRTLLYTVGGDGNLLFNVGPTPEGEIEARQVTRLQEMGAWVKQHGNSIYGTRGGPFKPGPWGVSTRAGNRITLFVMKWPADGRLWLPVLPVKITGATTTRGASVTLETEADGVTVIAPPEAERDPIATAIILKLAGPALPIEPLTVRAQDKGNLALGKPATASNTFQSNPTYAPDKAVDGDPETRWATDGGTQTAWLEVDLGSEQTVAMATVDEGNWNRVRRYTIQVKEPDGWKTVVEGETLGAAKNIPFPAPVRGRVFRLQILAASEGPTIHEFALRSPTGQPRASREGRR